MESRALIVIVGGACFALVILVVAVVAVFWVFRQPRSGKDAKSLAWKAVGDELGLEFVPGRKIGTQPHRLEGTLDGVEIVVTASMRSQGRYNPSIDITRFEAFSSRCTRSDKEELVALAGQRGLEGGVDEKGWVFYEIQESIEAPDALEEEVRWVSKKLAACD